MKQKCQTSVKLGSYDCDILSALQHTADSHVRVMDLFLTESHGIPDQPDLKQGVFHLDSELLHGSKYHGIIALLAA